MKNKEKLTMIQKIELIAEGLTDIDPNIALIIIKIVIVVVNIISLILVALLICIIFYLFLATL